MRILPAALLACFPLVAPLAAAAPPELRPTDANLITAIDVSGSIGRRSEALQFDGIADAIVDPDFLRIVAAGYHGRVGFAAFTWSSQGDFTMPVPWSLIESEATAKKIAARLLDARGKPRLAYSTSRSRSAGPSWRPSLATDLSAAIEHATILLANAPFAAARQVINISANGIDNVAPEPDHARNHALARGVVINGLVLGGDTDVTAYLRAHVQGGAGSFVLEAQRPADFASAIRRKFRMDLVERCHRPSRSHLGPPRAQTPHEVPVLTDLGDVVLDRKRCHGRV